VTADPARIEKAGLVYYKAGPNAFDDVVAFLEGDLGLPLKFRDGSAWAAFDGGGITVAVEGGQVEGATVEGPILGFRVTGLDTVLDQLARRYEVGAAAAGGHERRGHVRGPLPGPVVLYEPA
jgi:hypothetical protein